MLIGCQRTIMGKLIIIVVTFVMMASLKLAAARVKFAQEPSDTMIDQRQRVRLFCVITGLLPNQEVVWQKNNKTISIGLDMVSDRLTVDLKRYRIIGNRDKGYFDLKIIDIMRMDEGDYTCVVYNTTGTRLGAMEAQSRQAKVTVYYPPMEKYPYCPFGDSSRELTLGENIPACISELGRPKVLLELQGPYPDLPRTHTDYTTVSDFAVLTMNVSESDQGRTYTCRARSPDFPFYTSTCAVGPLRVVYPPRVAIRPIKVALAPGDEGVFICEIAAHPQPTRIEWTFIPPLGRSRYRLHDNNRTLVIPGLRASDDNRLMVCTVGNTKGNTSSERVLALSQEHRPHQRDPTHMDSINHSHVHFGFSRCSEANAVIIACLGALALVVMVLVCVVCCRAKHCLCLTSTRRSCKKMAHQKQQKRTAPIDAHHPILHDDTHFTVSSGT